IKKAWERSVSLSRALGSFHPEMALFRNLCVNLRNHLFPPWGGTRNSLISLTLRKIAHFCIENLICAR
ncbi:MAG: hypothetical protein PVG37_00860, partial [Desulfobacterales bacterium]